MAPGKTPPGPTDLTRNAVDVNDGTTPRAANSRDAGSAQAALAAAAPDAGATMPREQMNEGSAILAAFDLKNAVIWLNEDSLMKMEKALHAKRVLNADDIQTLSHEFAHVWQHRDVFEKNADQAARANALVREDTERISKMTEAQYIELRLGQERQAEQIALTIFAELKKSRELAFFAEQDADTWAHNARAEYVEGKKGFRAHYQDTRAKLAERQVAASGRAAKAISSVAAEAIGKPEIHVKMKLLSKLIPAFPGKEESVTLSKLLELMKRYNVLLVVSETIENTLQK